MATLSFFLGNGFKNALTSDYIDLGGTHWDRGREHLAEIVKRGVVMIVAKGGRKVSYEPVRVGTIKLGRYVIHPDDNEVYKVIACDHSKPGKHGAAKARMVLQNAFTGSKKQFISPVDKRINVPLIDKRMAQVTNITEDSIALMDNETYETFEAPLPIEENLKKKLISLFEAGKGIEVEYWNVMNKRKIQEVRELEL